MCFSFLNLCIIFIVFYIFPCVLYLMYVVHRCRCLCYIMLRIYVCCTWFAKIVLFDYVYWKGQSKYFALHTYCFTVVFVVNVFVFFMDFIAIFVFVSLNIFATCLVSCPKYVLSICLVLRWLFGVMSICCIFVFGS
jgi:hypothetical protein